MNKNAEPELLSFRAVIFDMDGVVTNTAKLHSVAWKDLFDRYLHKYAQQNNKPFVPFDKKNDYLSYVDGKPRYEGARSFLESRGIKLPYGEPSDHAETQSICGLGNSKDWFFDRLLHQQGPEIFDSTIKLIKLLKQQNIAVAIVSSSRNCLKILEMAGITSLFDARVDGTTSVTLGLQGKPNPDIFCKAAKLLNVANRDCIVVEDAVSGVQAGRRGSFGLVVGLNRGHNRAALAANGADIVLNDLSETGISDMNHLFSKKVLPLALDHKDQIIARLQEREVAIFLDYDGTLTPIVARPELAVLTDNMRSTLRNLAAVCPTAIISGRALSNVKDLVKIDELYYAGNHGFEIEGPHDEKILYDKGKEFVAAVKDACKRIEQQIANIDGAFVENKTYSLSVHYRLAAPESIAKIERIVDEQIKNFPNLQKHEGKKVFELRPNIDWNKGKAVLWMLQVLHLDNPEIFPIYIGDDRTDEDAFRSIKNKGLSILVSDIRQDSTADYALRNTKETGRFLLMLTTRLQEVYA